MKKDNIQQNIFDYKDEYLLENGESLPGFQLEYTTYGVLNSEKNNVIWVCHALTANSNFLEWWDGLFGSGKLFDPEKYFVICANVLGGCYGSTGPLSIKHGTKSKFYHDFPDLTNRDIVGSFNLLRQGLGINSVHTIIGGSLGGQHALEWAIEEPNVFERLILIATNAKHSAWGIAFNESQRMAIAQDLTWELSTDSAGIEGMKTARAIALLSYRNYKTYDASQSEKQNDKLGNFKASSYQRYQGEKLAQRFDAFTYWKLSIAMDSHNVGRNRGDIEKALSKIKAKTLSIGIDTDFLFPIEEQKFIGDNIDNASFQAIESDYGHDGFLIETDKLTECISQFYKEAILQKES